MSWKPKHAVNWRQLILAAPGVLARMLLVTPGFPRERCIPVREPRRAEIEHWLRNRN